MGRDKVEPSKSAWRQYIHGKFYCIFLLMSKSEDWPVNLFFSKTHFQDRYKSSRLSKCPLNCKLLTATQKLIQLEAKKYWKQNQQILKVRFEHFADFDVPTRHDNTSHSQYLHNCQKRIFWHVCSFAQQKNQTAVAGMVQAC
jgi:hypothetical protein